MDSNKPITFGMGAIVRVICGAMFDGPAIGSNVSVAIGVEGTECLRVKRNCKVLSSKCCNMRSTE